ncbi:MAG: regulator of protease activity HflC (stomatin/prohibitin superfamily) [Cellvibrionaceae bacterium]|jgi:regulator of protease activity HflC (stomatin/prohibitin superfamily)
MGPFIIGIILGTLGWFAIRCVIFGLYTVQQDERAVKTRFGRAVRQGKLTTLDSAIAEHLNEKERERYIYPQLQLIQPGGPYFKWPWEKIHKVNISTQTINMAFDPDTPQANQGGTVLEAVTKDELNIGLRGQIRYRVSEDNLYAYLFGVSRPISHITGYFVALLRDKIAGFEAKKPAIEGVVDVENQSEIVDDVSINDLRKNMHDLNEHMELECMSSAARYGITLDASLITEIDPPSEVDSALAAINTAHNHVSSEISLARAEADQKIVQSRRAVEIETLNAEAEVEPLLALANQLNMLKKNAPNSLELYKRNIRLQLYRRAGRAILEEDAS